MDTYNNGLPLVLNASWDHNYAVIPGTVLSAILTIRVWDYGTCCGIDRVYPRGGFPCSGAPDLHANLLKKTAGNDKCIAH